MQSIAAHCSIDGRLATKKASVQALCGIAGARLFAKFAVGKTLGRTGGMGRFCRVAARGWKNIRAYRGNGAVFAGLPLAVGKTLGRTGGMERFRRFAARTWKNIRPYRGNGAV